MQVQKRNPHFFRLPRQCARAEVDAGLAGQSAGHGAGEDGLGTAGAVCVASVMRMSSARSRKTAAGQSEDQRDRDQKRKHMSNAVRHGPPIQPAQGSEQGDPAQVPPPPSPFRGVSYHSPQGSGARRPGASAPPPRSPFRGVSYNSRQGSGAGRPGASAPPPRSPLRGRERRYREADERPVHLIVRAASFRT